MWKPFDLRFQKILAYIQVHQQIVREELQFVATAASQSTLGNDIAQLKQREYQALTEATDRMKETHDDMSISLITS